MGKSSRSYIPAFLLSQCPQAGTRVPIRAHPCYPWLILLFLGLHVAPMELGRFFRLVYYKHATPMEFGDRTQAQYQF